MSVDHSQPISNQVNPTQQANNQGGGLGGGSARSYKSKFKKRTEDKFSLSEQVDKEITQELMSKSLMMIIREFIQSVCTFTLNLFGIKKKVDENSDIE
jgi:hypothetical protein